jgi:hypothetical protein
LSKRFAFIIALFLAAGCDQPPQPSAAAKTDSMPAQTDADSASISPGATSEGWGVLKVGMTRAEVVSAAGETEGTPAPPSNCEEFHPRGAPAGMTVMIEQGMLTRITLSAPSTLATDKGFKVGDPAAAVKKAYGSQAQVTPHKYSAAPAEYITVWSVKPPEPDPRGIVYEIGTDGRVQHIHLGGPSIQYVEGCS